MQVTARALLLAGCLALVITCGCSSQAPATNPDGGIDAGDDGGGDTDQPQKIYVEDSEYRDCDSSTAGWLVIDPTGASTADAQLQVINDAGNVQAGAGALEFAYPRPADRFPGLFATLLLTEFETLSLWLKSEKDAALLLVVSDRDGARFQYRTDLAAGTWRQLVLRPDDFTPDPDSPVQKQALEPERLAMGLVLVDLQRNIPADANRLWIDEVEVVRKPLLLLENLLVQDEQLTITESALLEGDATVSGSGGALTVQAPRLRLRGNLETRDGAAFLADGPVLSSEQQYVSHYRLDTASGGSITLRNVLLHTGFPQFLRSRSGCRLELDHFSSLLSATHIETESGAVVSISSSTNVGELVLQPGAGVSISDTNVALVWLFTPAGTSGTFTLPDGASITDFSLGPPFDLTVSNSTGIMWGLVSYPGSDVTFRDTDLLVAGLLFLGSGQQTLAGFRNNGPIPDLSVLADRTLAFVNSSVAIWNFYPADGFDLQVTDSLFGELLAFGQATATVHDSTCDGSGGYIGTEGDSRLEIYASELDNDITTFDRSTLLLDGCTVHGDIRATGSSSVVLRNTIVDGALLEFDSGSIVVE